MSDKKEEAAEAPETKGEAEAEKAKKNEKKTKKSTKKVKKITKKVTRTKTTTSKATTGKTTTTKSTGKKVVKKKTTPKTETEEKTKSPAKPKAKATTTKPAAKPKKATTTKTKKAVKKTENKKTTEKKTTEKKTTPKPAKKTTEQGPKLLKFEKWVAEAIKALSTEDKEWVSFLKIKQYLHDYMDGPNENFIPHQAKNTIQKFVEQKYLKKKRDSYAFTSKGKEKIAPSKVPSRSKISGRTDAPKRRRFDAIEEVTFNTQVKTQNGRLSKQRDQE